MQHAILKDYLLHLTEPVNRTDRTLQLEDSANNHVSVCELTDASIDFRQIYRDNFIFTLSFILLSRTHARTHTLSLSVSVSLTHKHTHTHMYIYIYIYANFIKHNRHFMSTYFLLDPFEFPYYFYCILGELIKVLSIVACIPNTFCPTLGHHQGRIYYKSDVTFVLANYYCVRTSFAVEDYDVCF